MRSCWSCRSNFAARRRQFVFITDDVELTDSRAIYTIKTKTQPKDYSVPAALVGAAALDFGKQSVPIYKFMGRGKDDSNHMFDLVIDETITVRHCLCLVFSLPSWLRHCLCLRPCFPPGGPQVPEFKDLILAKMEEEGEDIAGKHLRVCELGRDVMMDSETLLKAVIMYKDRNAPHFTAFH